jgi:hypothetical protein
VIEARRSPLPSLIPARPSPHFFFVGIGEQNHDSTHYLVSA